MPFFRPIKSSTYFDPNAPNIPPTTNSAVVTVHNKVILASTSSTLLLAVLIDSVSDTNGASSVPFAALLAAVSAADLLL